MTATGGTPSWAAADGLARATDTPPLTVPAEDARRAAERELSRPMYHEHDPNLFQRALNRFWDWAGGLLDRAAGATPGGTLGLVAVVLVVALALLALWWRLGSPRSSRTTPTAPLFDTRPRSAAEHRATAEAHAARGHWNAAVQERMRAVFRALEERALLDPRPGRTADEAAAEAGRCLPAYDRELHSAARDFDSVAYGGHSADAALYERLTALDTDVEGSRPVLTTDGGASR
ncbi:DUF4129 domain-containing protein [Streptomyces sp. NPDC049954]|uniref:DUF4129 domain-containing protein n=1 Tax=Streptomyces sp. NPDC049954 TaxID=3155779 RepID=UPI00343AED1A